MQNGARHVGGREEAGKIRGIGGQIFRAVVKERRRHRPFLVHAERFGALRRQKGDADAVRPAGGFFERKRLFRVRDPIQAFPGEIGSDLFPRIGRHVLPRRRQHPDAGGRDLFPFVGNDGKRLLKAGGKRLFLRFRPALLFRAGADGERRVLQDVLRLPPGGEIAQHIRADQPEKFPFGILRLEVAAGEISVTRPSPGYLVIAHFRTGDVPEGDAAHRETVGVGGKDFVPFMRGAYARA